MRKASFDQEIIDTIDYYIGFAHFIKTMGIAFFRDLSRIYDISDIYIITSSKINLETINFTEWYEANKTILWEFSEKFVKLVFDNLIDMFNRGEIHIIHVDGYFPLANTKLRGERIKRLLDECE